jgi:hypothetical protein
MPRRCAKRAAILAKKDMALTRAKGVTAEYHHPAAAAAITQLEKAMGGRQALVGALMHAPPTDALAYVVGLIADPRYDGMPLSTLCASGRITVGELLEAYKRGVMAQAQVAAIHKVAVALPAVVDDVMTRAQVHQVTCTVCDGTGAITPEPTPKTPNPSPEPCKSCHGHGTHICYPDLDRQKVAIDLAGMGPKSAPMVDLSDRRTVNIVDPSQGGLAALIGAVDQVLHRKAPSVVAVSEAPVSSESLDAEVIPADTGADPISSPPDGPTTHAPSDGA